MKIGPKFKIARRLGASVFEKTQGQKFAISSSRRSKPVPGANPKGSYAIAVIEKQRVRFTYGITAKQLTNYVRAVIAKKSLSQADDLFRALETRLDNAVARAGFAPSRRMARQLVSHGHFTVNGVRTTIPSFKVSEGDVIAVRDASKDAGPFVELDKRVKDTIVPTWIKSDAAGKLFRIDGMPALKVGETAFDLTKVIEFYKR